MTSVPTADSLEALRGLIYEKAEDAQIDRHIMSMSPMMHPTAFDYCRGHGRRFWAKYALQDNEEPLEWDLWGRVRKWCELVPRKVCGECEGKGAVPDLPQGHAEMVAGGWALLKASTKPCDHCDGKGEIPPMLVWRTPMTFAQQAFLFGRAELLSAGRLPATELSWNQALWMCNKLSVTYGLRKAYSFIDDQHGPEIFDGDNGFRLPTVAQWRHLAGELPQCWTCSQYPHRRDDLEAFGEVCPECGYAGRHLDRFAWHADNSGHKVQPVAKKEPNEYGLFDCWGNIEEFVWGFYEGAWMGNNAELEAEVWDEEPMTVSEVGEEPGYSCRIIGLRPILPLRRL